MRDARRFSNGEMKEWLREFADSLFESRRLGIGIDGNLCRGSLGSK